MNTANRVLVCVTQQKTCERLIHKALDLAGESDGELHVIHVAKNKYKFLDNDKEGEALEYLFDISKKAGASLTVLKSDDILKAIKDYVTSNKINCIVLGRSPDKEKNNVGTQLERAFKTLDIIIVP